VPHAFLFVVAGMSSSPVVVVVVYSGIERKELEKGGERE
jgi:hypothetical protein